MASDVTLYDLQSMSVNYYFTVISISIAVYEYCLTFVSEVERFWKGGPLNWASGLFYLNRYLVLFGHIPVVIEFFWSTSNPEKIKICQKLQSYHQYLAIAIQVIVASMLVMRMYALYERSRHVLALYFAVCTIIVGIGFFTQLVIVAVFTWAVLGGKSQKPREVLIPLGCGASLTHNQAIRMGAAWAGMLGFDSLVFGMTLYKSLTLAWIPGANLLTILLRDGTMYYAVMMASNLGNILAYVFGGPFTRGVATTFTNIISSVMISRLMLNLRDPTLVRHAPKHMGVGEDDTTYPNLTFMEPTLSTVQLDSDAVGDREGHDVRVNRDGARGGSSGRGRGAYDYLAMGSSSQKYTRDVELLALQTKPGR